MAISAQGFNWHKSPQWRDCQPNARGKTCHHRTKTDAIIIISQGPLPPPPFFPLHPPSLNQEATPLPGSIAAAALGWLTMDACPALARDLEKFHASYPSTTRNHSDGFTPTHGLRFPPACRREEKSCCWLLRRCPARRRRAKEAKKSASRLLVQRPRPFRPRSPKGLQPRNRCPKTEAVFGSWRYPRLWAWAGATAHSHACNTSFWGRTGGLYKSDPDSRRTRLRIAC